MKCDKLSATRINSYKMCPFKYYLEYERHIESPPNFGAAQGSLIHEVFEHIGSGILSGQDGPVTRTNWQHYILSGYRNQKIWTLNKKQPKKTCEKCDFCIEHKCSIADQPVEKVEGCPRLSYNDALKMASQIIDSPDQSIPLNRKILAVERDFNIELQHGDETIKVCGYIDIITENNPNTIEIVDYKTGTFMKNYQECCKDPQLLIYHLAGGIIYPQYKNILVTIYYLRDKPMTFAFTADNDIKTVRALANYWYLIRGDNAPIPKALNNGELYHDWQCKALCNPAMCSKMYAEFIKNGGMNV